MRKSDIAYVPNPPRYNPPEKLENMSIEDIIKKYIKTCGKADGKVSVCSHCQAPCEYGKRAIQLLANQVYPEPTVPLFAGMTMIRKAQEENKRRREEMEKKPTVKERKTRSSSDWWEESLKSRDQVSWVMNKFSLSEKQAKTKIAQHIYYRRRVGLSIENEKPVEKPVDVPKQETAEVITSEISIEAKINSLMEMKKKAQGEADHYYTLYQEAKMRVEEINGKIDVLYNAFDIISGG